MYLSGTFFIFGATFLCYNEDTALWRSGYAAVCKTAYAGSIPAGTSINIVSPDGGIGIRVRLKIEWRNPYGFKSHLGHQDNTFVTISA